MPRLPPLLLLPALACARKDGASYRTEAVTRGPVSEIVNATGDVSAIVTVNVGSQVSGIIDKLYVDWNSKVKKGQLLATLDPRLFNAKQEILANIDEADVGKVHEGAESKFTVDAYPGEAFTGSIREVRQAPTTIQNVVTYAAVIDAPNPDRKLRQGMTASVTITTAHKDDALRVSNAALRFRPEDTGAAEPVAAPQQRSGGGAPMARGATAASRGKPEGASPQGPGRPGRVYTLDATGQRVPV